MALHHLGSNTNVPSFSPPNNPNKLNLCLRTNPYSSTLSSYCLSSQSQSHLQINEVEPNYKPGVLDHIFLNLFRSKMVQEVGRDSPKPGYDGLIDVANSLMIARTNSETKEAAVRILRSLFPPLLLELYKMLIAPIGGGKVAAMMVARVTALSCQWLMGKCTVNSVHLPDGTSLMSGVFVERCKYLEESKCVGICVNTCKLPTQAFFKDDMGVPLLMEPNFTDYSCQFKFGVLAEEDGTLKEACLETCPNATRRKARATTTQDLKCPKA